MGADLDGGAKPNSRRGTWGIRSPRKLQAANNLRNLGIGEFDLGIWFEPGSSGRACGNFVGTDLTGDGSPRPNYDGIWVERGSKVSVRSQKHLVKA